MREYNFTIKLRSTATKVATLCSLAGLRSIGTSLTDASMIRFPLATAVFARIDTSDLLNISCFGRSHMLSHLTLMLSGHMHGRANVTNSSASSHKFSFYKRIASL